MTNCNQSKSLTDQICFYREFHHQLSQQFPGDTAIRQLSEDINSLDFSRESGKHQKVKNGLSRLFRRSQNELTKHVDKIRQSFWYSETPENPLVKEIAEYGKLTFDGLGNILCSVAYGKVGGATWGAAVPFIEYGVETLLHDSDTDLPAFMREKSGHSIKSVAVESGMRAIFGAFLGKTSLQSGAVLGSVFFAGSVTKNYVEERSIDWIQASIHGLIGGAMAFVGHLFGDKFQRYLTQKAQQHIEFALTKGVSSPLLQMVKQQTGFNISLKMQPATKAIKYPNIPSLTHDISPSSARELAQHQAQIVSGKVCDAQGNPITTILDDQTHAFIYTMDSRGNFYIANRAEYLHPHLSVTNEVAGAGEMVIENGTILRISNASGHFRPTEAIFKNSLGELSSQGASFHPEASVIVLENMTTRRGAQILNRKGAYTLDDYLKYGADNMDSEEYHDLYFKFVRYLSEGLKGKVGSYID